MAWKENTKPHQSENIGSEQRGDSSERQRPGEARRLGAGPFGRGSAMTGRLDVSTARAPAPARATHTSSCIFQVGSPFFGLQGAQAQDLCEGAAEQWGCAWGPVVPGDARLLLTSAS